jgi:hypothetical protein
MLGCALMLSTKIACATWIYKFQYAKKCKYNIISDLMKHVQKIYIQILWQRANIINQST